MHITDIYKLTDACEAAGVKLPDYIAEATQLRDATQALLNEVRSETEPDAYTLTSKNLAALHSQMVAWPSNAARATVAARLAQVAEGKIGEAWQRFGATLIDALRVPFDDAVSRWSNGDPDAQPTISKLADARDTLAVNLGSRAELRSDPLERITRILIPATYNHAVNLIPHRTAGVERYGAEWLRIVVGLDSVLKWQTPAEQVETDRALAKGGSRGPGAA